MAVKQTAGIGKGTPGPGRKKGVPNKVTQSAKEALQLAFQGAGGVEALTKFAKEQPAHFYAIWGRIIPKPVEVQGEGGGPVRVTIEYVDADE